MGSKNDTPGQFSINFRSPTIVRDDLRRSDAVVGSKLVVATLNPDADPVAYLVTVKRQAVRTTTNGWQNCDVEDIAC